MAAEMDGRRSSIEKRPLTPSPPSAFGRLPDEIIQQILEAADPNGFASLVLLNSKWRAVSQQAHLYADHLSRCPSYAASHKTPPSGSSDDALPGLRRAFAREVKRNLFDAYLRPRQTVIKVISNSISPSSCPGGEGIQFRASPRGCHLLAYNSSRIYVVDVRGDAVEVRREFKILRRPAATCINDEGTMLVVLLTEMQVDVYDLTASPPRRTRSTILDNSPRAIALSPCCSVLAAAYEGGIEVSSLAPNAIAADHRAVKCDPVDALAFSFDGTQILGTTLHSSQPNTVILTAPYYDPGSHMTDGSGGSAGGSDISALWTTSILFPNSTRDCSHAALLQGGRAEEAAWTFTYDRGFETFRAVRIDDLRNGTTYFTGPIPTEEASQSKLLPCTLPAASYDGDLVSAGFRGREVWLYGVPEDLDAVPDNVSSSAEAGAGAGGSSPSASLNRRNSGPSTRHHSPGEAAAARLPKWQVLCDKFRNTFVSGRKIAELDGVSTANWVAGFGGSPLKERLVVAARGVVPPKPASSSLSGFSPSDEDGIDFVDGGRIALVDFDYGLCDGRTTEITIEVGTKEPETLEEEHRDIDTEVAIVRRRTVAQRNKTRTTATTTARPPTLPSQASSASSRSPAPASDVDADDDPLVPRRVGLLRPPASRRPDEQPAAVAEDVEAESIEEQEALDAPYSHASPRSGTTLRRAATAAAANRRLHPPPAVAGRVPYRRADGRTEHPHESDADNWVPPPPPYQKDDPGDLPAFLRHAASPIAPVSGPAQQQQQQQQQQQPQQQPQPQPQPQQQPQPQPQYQQQQRPQPQPQHQPQYSTRPQTTTPSLGRDPPMPTHPVPPPSSVYTSSPSTYASSPLRPAARPATSQSHYLDGANIYDVSPPGTPRAASSVGHHGRSPSETRTPSNNSAMRRISEVSVISPVSPDLSQRPLPAIPRIQTAAAPFPQTPFPQAPFQSPYSPVPGRAPVPLSAPQQPGPLPPQPRPLSNAQTWPVEPGTNRPQPPHIAAMASASSGYPYSAPPVSSNPAAEQMLLNRALPPAPRPDQVASLNRRPDQPSHRLSLSGGSHSGQAGSRSSLEYGVRSQQQQQQPPPPPQQYTQQQYQQQQPPQHIQQQYLQQPQQYMQQQYTQHPQQQQYSQQQPTQQQYAQQQPQQYPQQLMRPLQQHVQPLPETPRVRRSSTAPSPQQSLRQPEIANAEDMPLIISTPTGVMGAYDSPVRRPSDRRAETPIFAPVARPGRPSAQSILRPVVDRIDNLYTAAQGSFGGGGAHGSNAGASSSTTAPPAAVPYNNNYLLPPPHPHTMPVPGGASRVSSLNRKQSRAERSAAKNMADAKRRGWTGGRRGRSKRRRKGGKKSASTADDDRDLDAASSAAWTDVTTASVRSAGVATAPPMGGGRRGWAGGGKHEGGPRDRKCIVM